MKHATRTRDLVYIEEMRILGVVVMTAAVGTAHADELAQPDPTQSPGFVTMLHGDAVSRAGADLTYFVIDNSSDTTLLRLDLHGHYVDPVSGLGGYAQVPVTFAFGNNDSETVLGGAEVGGLYAPKLSSPGIGVVLRAGLALPTVTDGDTGLLNFIGTYLRPTDLYAQLPKAASLRLSVSPMIRSGSFFARLDAGIDINLYFDGNDTADPGVELNLGAGVDLGSAAIMGELTTFALTGDNGETLTSAALSVRGHAGAVQPYASLLIPVDSDVSDVFDLGLLAGVEGRL